MGRLLRLSLTMARSACLRAWASLRGAGPLSTTTAPADRVPAPPRTTRTDRPAQAAVICAAWRLRCQVDPGGAGDRLCLDRIHPGQSSRAIVFQRRAHLFDVGRLPEYMDSMVALASITPQPCVQIVSLRRREASRYRWRPDRKTSRYSGEPEPGALVNGLCRPGSHVLAAATRKRPRRPVPPDRVATGRGATHAVPGPEQRMSPGADRWDREDHSAAALVVRPQDTCSAVADWRFTHQPVVPPASRQHHSVRLATTDVIANSAASLLAPVDWEKLARNESFTPSSSGTVASRRVRWHRRCALSLLPMCQRTRACSPLVVGRHGLAVSVQAVSCHWWAGSGSMAHGHCDRRRSPRGQKRHSVRQRR